MTTKHKDFEITSVATDEVGDKLDTISLEDLLNDQLKLRDYGSGVKKVFFVFLVVPANNSIHENEVFFDSENHTIEAALKLDYDLILKGSKTTAKKMMYELFCSLFEIDIVQALTDFDYKGLQDNLEHLK